MRPYSGAQKAVRQPWRPSWQHRWNVLFGQRVLRACTQYSEVPDMPLDRDERIRQRAYEIWEREGRPHGREEEHWRLAVDELVEELREAKVIQDVPAERVTGAGRASGASAAETQPSKPVSGEPRPAAEADPIGLAQAATERNAPAKARGGQVQKPANGAPASSRSR
jgi:Protein of unknown function (DUF2934)